MPPGLPARLFVYCGTANFGKIASLWKRKVPESTCTTRLRTVSMRGLATPALLVVRSLHTVHICGDHKQ